MPVVYGIQDLSDDGNLARLGNNIVDGLSNGAIWALVALGYTLVYGIIELINFAHGEVFMIGSLVIGRPGSGQSIGLTAATGDRRPRSSGCSVDSGRSRCSPAARST